MVVCVICKEEKPGCDWKPEVGGAKCCDCCEFICHRNPKGTKWLPGTKGYVRSIENLMS